MPTKISAIESMARLRLVEATPSFWSSAELTDIIIAGIRDLWRDVVDLKQEHYFTRNTVDVSLPAGTDHLIGVPADIHKVYLIEPVDTTVNSTNAGLSFSPLDYNHKDFIAARGMDAIDPTSAVIYYCITGQGAPVNAPVIYCAPKVTSAVSIAFTYIPTLPSMDTNSNVPIPGEADNALVAWTVAFARAKEDDNRAPDANWLSIYATEKSHLMQSLGLRQYQEPTTVDALFGEYW